MVRGEHSNVCICRPVLNDVVVAIVLYVLSYWLDSPGLESQSRQALGPILTSLQRGSLSGIKWSQREVNHSPPSGAEVKDEWSHTSNPPTCLHGADSKAHTKM
jgi:hypothetical protein